MSYSLFVTFYNTVLSNNYLSTKKRQYSFDTLRSLFFVRHSSDYKMSDSDRKGNRSIYPDAVTRDRMRLM